MPGNQLRFYLPPDSRSETEFQSSDPSFLHQLLHVLRLQKGDQITLFTGQGEDYLCEITHLDKKLLRASLLKTTPKPASQAQIHLFLALPKQAARFELVCEKVTEIGLQSITPLLTARTLKTNLNLGRLQKIIIEAAEQSGRATLPALHPAQDLASALTSISCPSFIFDGNTAAKPFPLLLSQNSSPEIALFIGPEGGFQSEEIDLALARGAQSASLGTQILRLETAAIVASALVFQLTSS